MKRCSDYTKTTRSGKASGKILHVETLERRTLLTATVVQAIPNQVFAQDSGVEQANLYGVFADNNGLQDLTFSATSSNPAVLTASVSGSLLSITPVAGESGFARVQMVANDPLGVRVSNTFRVQITAADTRSLDVLLGDGSPGSIRFVQSNGAAATVSLAGPGSAVLHFGGDNLARAGTVLNGSNEELESITLSDTTSASTLNVTGTMVGGALASVGNVSASGSLGHLNINKAILDGDVNVTGALPAINVDFAEGGTFTIGSGAVSIVGQTFIDENFSSSSPVSSIKLLQWTSSDNVPETFTGAFVKSLTVRGNFTPGLQLSGVGANGRTLGSVKIPGTVGGTWNITGASAPLTVGQTQAGFNATFGGLPSFTSKADLVGHLTAPTIKSINVRSYIGGATITLTAPGTTDVQSIKARALSYATIVAAGNIGSITAKLMQYTSVLAGIAPIAPATLPASADFVASATIKSIQAIGGVTSNAFISNWIAASTLGSMNFNKLATDNSGFPFGVAANGIGELQFLTGKKKIVLKGVHDAATLASQLGAQNAKLGDMVIDIF